MSTESTTRRTRSLTASGNHNHYAPSRATLAARSLLAVDRLPEGSPERSEAMARHFAEFATPLRRACPLPR